MVVIVVIISLLTKGKLWAKKFKLSYKTTL